MISLKNPRTRVFYFSNISPFLSQTNRTHLLKFMADSSNLRNPHKKTPLGQTDLYAIIDFFDSPPTSPTFTTSIYPASACGNSTI